MARSSRVKSDLTVSYDSGYVDMVKTYSYLLKELHTQKFTKTLERAVYRVVDNRFKAYMIANKEEYKHVFEWESNRPLWITELVLGVVGYTFLPSTKNVPAKLPHTKYRHVFREKARVMEAAPAVTIAPVQAKYLRWRGAQGEEVRSYQAIEIDQVAGGKYKNSFQNAFILYWATAGDSSMAEIAHAVSSSPKYRFEVRQNKINGLKRSMTMQSKKAQSNDAVVAAMAKERMTQIIAEAKKIGYSF